MSLRQRVLKGVLWSGGLSLALQAPNFLLGMFLARILGKETFGEWGIIQNTIGSISNVAQLALAITATKYVAELRHADPKRVGSILGLCSFVTLVTAGIASLGLLVSAPFLAASVFHAPHLTLAVRVSIAYLFFLTINGYQIGALSGLEAFRRLATIGGFYGAATLVTVLVAARLFGLDGAVLAMSACAAANWFFHHVHLKRYCASHGIEVHYRHLARELPVLTSFALPATLAGVASSAGVWLSNVTLVRVPHGYEEMAVLTAGMSFRSVILFAPSVISRVSMPLLVNLFGNRDHDEYQRGFLQNIWALTGFAVIAAIPLSLLAPYLLVAFGRSFVNGASTVVVLSVAAVLEVSALAFYQQVFTSGWMWWGLCIVVVRSALLVGLAAALTPRLGALGVAWANAAAQGGSLALTYLIVRVKMPSLFQRRVHPIGPPIS